MLRYISHWLSDDTAFREGFEYLSSPVVALNHPNIARTYEYGAINQRLYTLSEYVEGVSLQQLLDRQGEHAAISGNGEATGIPLHIIRYVAHILCDALHAIHSVSNDQGQPVGLLYRNIAPSQITVLSDGTMVLRDPGPWRRLWLHGQPYSVVHRPSQLYRASEDLEGDGYDERSDVFALGRTLVALLRAPGAAHSAAEGVRHLRSNLALLSQRGDPLAAVLERATASTSMLRFPSAEAMQRALTPLSEEVREEARADLAAMHASYRRHVQGEAAPSEEGHRTYARSSTSNNPAVSTLPSPEPRGTRPAPSDQKVVNRRSATVDLDLDSMPELAALRRRTMALPNPDQPLDGFDYDAPPPNVPMRVSSQSRPSIFHDDAPAADVVHRRTPDPRVQTLSDALRRVIQIPEAHAVRVAARRRLAGDAAGALGLLRQESESASADIQAALAIERAFALLEAGQYEEAHDALLCLTQTTTLTPHDVTLVAYYQVITSLALGQKKQAEAALTAISWADAERFPDLTQLRLFVVRMADV